MFNDKRIKAKGELTVEKVLCKCFIGHIFCHKQPLISFIATTEQICQSLVTKLTD